MNNPYISRGPVRIPEMFFGREHELQEIAAFLAGNQSVSMIGPRKIGKTSLLFHLLRPEIWPTIGLDERNLFIYLDCEVLGEGGHAEIFGQFAAEMAAALDERGLPPEPALETALTRPTRLSFEAAVRKLNQRGLRVVLILDEFERLSTNSALDVNFFNALRSAAGRYQLAFITASARPLIELTYSGRSQEILSSPFFNIFAPLFLGLLSREESLALIREPAAHAGRPFPEESQAFIYELAGGHPLALQVACFHAWRAAGDHAAIEQQTLQELEAHFQYAWHNLTPAEQETLHHIARNPARAESGTTMRGVLRDLVQKCLLVADGESYRYSSRAWACFVAAQPLTSDRPTHPARPVLASADSPSMLETRVGGLLVGAQIGPYEILKPIGHGGMAEVYEGRHLRLGRPVAIKILSASLAAEADFRTRFEREARAVAALNHPHIVQVYDFGDVNGMYYMAMEYIAGSDLAQRLRESGPLSLDEARRLLRDVAGALDYAHALGMVHRDVKPSNVLLRPSVFPEGQCRAVLTDFGIARIRSGGNGVTKAGMMMGTLEYMAPEQIRSPGEVDGRADVYALGVMLFQMLTGQLPFTGDNPGSVMLAHLQQPAPDPRTLVPDLPEQVAAAILRALAKDPAERFHTPGALAEALDG